MCTYSAEVLLFSSLLDIGVSRCPSESPELRTSPRTCTLWKRLDHEPREEVEDARSGPTIGVVGDEGASVPLEIKGVES